MHECVYIHKGVEQGLVLGNQEGPIIRHCPGFSADWRWANLSPPAGSASGVG